MTNDTFGLSRSAVATAEELLSRQSRRTDAAVEAATISGTTEDVVLFYNHANEGFARGWQGTDTDRWIFPVATQGVRFMYYICMRIKQVSGAPVQVLVATKGEAGGFWAAPDSALSSSDGVVGYGTSNVAPATFGSTLKNLVGTTATVTILSGSTASGSNGTTLLGAVGKALGGYTLASEGAVTLATAGTATTSSKIMVGKSDGTTAVAQQAGTDKTYPLGTYPWTTVVSAADETVASTIEEGAAMNLDARTNVTVITVLDVSASMGPRPYGWSYLTPAKADANTFLNMMQSDDQMAVLSFSDSVSQVYPTSGLAAVDASSKASASTAVMGLESLNNTNIGDAIKEAQSLLSSTSSHRGIVLLSDGMWNVGPDPTTVLKSIPIYTISLGSHGQLEVLQEIATKTGGRALSSPDASGLASIYFEILASTKVGSLVTLGANKYSTRSVQSSVAKLAVGLDNASVGVNWADPSISYVSGTASTGQVSVQILDPDFNKWTGTPDYQKDGFAVFNIPNPKAGDWIVNATYGGGGSAVLTTGALDPDLSTALTLDAPTEAVASGQPITIHAQVSHRGEAVPGCAITASADQPSISVDDAIARHRDELVGIHLPEGMPLDHPNTERVRLEALRQRKLPHEEILPRHSSPVRVEEVAPGHFTLEVPTSVPGIYNVQAEAIGPHPRGGELMRTRLVSVVVR